MLLRKVLPGGSFQYRGHVSLGPPSPPCRPLAHTGQVVLPPAFRRPAFTLPFWVLASPLVILRAWFSFTYLGIVEE